MAHDLLNLLEKKVEHALEVIELLRLQVEDLEEENITLKADQERWRHDLGVLLKRFDHFETSTETTHAEELEGTY